MTIYNLGQLEVATRSPAPVATGAPAMASSAAIGAKSKAGEVIDLASQDSENPQGSQGEQSGCRISRAVVSGSDLKALCAVLYTAHDGFNGNRHSMGQVCRPRCCG